MSILWALPEIAEEGEDARVLKVCYCMMGKKFRKRTRLMVWCVQDKCTWDVEAHICQQCYHCNSTGDVCKRTGKKHLLLRGWCRGKALTQKGEKYPRKFVNLIARVLCSRNETTAD